MTDDGSVVSGGSAKRVVFGAAAQASLAGAYAWAVAVAPLVWAPGASAATKVGAGVALLALAWGAAGDRWGLRWTRPVSLWGVVLGSAFTWSTFPIGLGIARIDPVRGISGMVAWALYALAYAGPALEPLSEPARTLQDAALVERRKLRPGDLAYVVAGTVVACALQLPGWTLPDPGRALLTRLVAVASGLAAIGIATDLAVRRNEPIASRARRKKRRRIDPQLLLQVVVLVALALAWSLAWLPGGMQP